MTIKLSSGIRSLFILMTLLLAQPRIALAEVPADVSREFINSIKGVGFKGALNFLEREKQLPLCDHYSEIQGKVSLKRPNLMGFFILEVGVIGRHFRDFEAYYDTLSEDRRSRLRRAILSESKLDVYIQQTRENLRRSYDPGPVYNTIVHYLDTIELFLNRLRHEEG